MSTRKSLPSKTFFERRIRDFFEKAGREHLPWRRKKITAYEVWVSEIMLQQTQVSRVIGYYERFLQKFPTVEALAEATWETFLPYYEGLGYYARGRNMLRTAKTVVQEWKGRFPRRVDDLMTLPGVGPYTARAIASFAYGENVLAWDTNLRRVIGRYFRGRKDVSVDGAEKMVFTLPAKTLNAALMDFGSSICVARPKCEACMLRSQCRYFAEEGRKERQTKRSRPSVRIDVAKARALVTLHERHRAYFSSDPKRYVPFRLPRGYASRAAIKEWFLEHYGLVVSVRPPHEKKVVRGVPVVVVNAQILSGEHRFKRFPKEKAGGV